MTIFKRRRLLVGVAGLAVTVAGVITIGVMRAEPPRMTASVDHQHRSEEADDRVPVEIRNHGERQVMVSRMEVVSATITIRPAQDVPFRVRAGNSRRIQLIHEGSRCPDAGPPAPGAASLRLVFTDGGTLSLALPDPEQLLSRLTDEDCALERIFKVAEVRFGDEWRRAIGPDGPRLRGALVLDRRSDGPDMTVTGPRGSTLIELWKRRDTSVLRAEMPRREIPIEAEVTRCDAHGLIESKKSFQFATWVRLGGEAERYFELRAGPELEARMRGLAADTCKARQG